MVKEIYVSFETAKLLKRNGFDEPCLWGYDPYGASFAKVLSEPRNSELNEYEYSKPTQQVVMMWFRELYKIDIAVYPYGDYPSENYQFDVYKKRSLIVSKDDGYMTYEEAVEAAIKYCLENLI